MHRSRAIWMSCFQKIAFLANMFRAPRCDYEHRANMFCFLHSYTQGIILLIYFVSIWSAFGRAIGPSRNFSLSNLFCRYVTSRFPTYGDDFTTSSSVLVSGRCVTLSLWKLRLVVTDIHILYFFRDDVVVVGSVVVLGIVGLYARARFPGDVSIQNHCTVQAKTTAPKFSCKVIKYSWVVATTTTAVMVHNGCCTV